MADAPITFSDGSTKTAASVAVSDSDSVGFSWPTALPTPTISGSVTTYRNVQPGVDLRVQALTDGYDLQIILTKAPTSAAVFRIPLVLQGLTAQRASVTGQRAIRLRRGNGGGIGRCAADVGRDQQCDRPADRVVDADGVDRHVGFRYRRSW